jgi:hypothetical protein
MVNYCPEDSRNAALEQVQQPAPNGNGDAIYFRCPHGGLAMLDAILVQCSGGYSPDTCPTLKLLAKKLKLSHEHIIAFGEHLPGTAGSAQADDPNNAFLIKAVKGKR